MQFDSKSFALQALAVATTLAFSPLANASVVAVGTCAVQATCATNVQNTNAANYPNGTGASGYTTYSAGSVTIAGSAVQPGTIVGNSSITLTNSQVSSQGQSNVPLGTGVTGTFTGTATVANTSVPNVTAAPVTDLAGNTAPVYLTTNSGTSTASSPSANSYTLKFATAESYLGLLWGSIGIGDLLTFYNTGGSVVAQITGQDAINAATGYNGAMGARGFGGSQYTLINFLNGATFQSVTFSQTIAAAFETANIQYGTTNVSPIPEPGSIALFGIGMAGFAAARRRKAARA